MSESDKPQKPQICGNGGVCWLLTPCVCGRIVENEQFQAQYE